MFKDIAQQDNLGFISRVLMIDHLSAQVDSNYDHVTVDPDAEVFELYFKNKAATLSSHIANSAHGLLHKISLGIKVPKIIPDSMSWIRKNLNRRWVVLAEDANGYVHALGNLEDGCQMAVETAIDGSTNGFKIDFEWQTGHGQVLGEFLLDDITNMGKTIDLRKYDTRNIIVVKGDSLSLSLNFYDATGTVENLAGNTFSCKVKDSGGSEVLAFAIGSGFTLTDSNTTLAMAKTAVQMAAVAVGVYYYDIQRTYANATVETVLKGTFTIESDIS